MKPLKPQKQPPKHPLQQMIRWALPLATLAMGVLAVFVAALLFTATGECKKIPPAAPVDLNTATAAQIQQVPGIGPATAKAIVAFREKSGPFERVGDLLAIRGITRRKLDQIRRYVTVRPRIPAGPSAGHSPR